MFRNKRGFAPVLAMLCLVMISVPVLAQEAAEADMAAMMAAGQPGEHHQHMAFQEGSWNVKGQFWMPGAPGPMESDGTATFKWILGGRFMHQSYSSQFMGMDFQGIGTTGYDNLGKKYMATWTDNMTTSIMSETGQCDGSGKKTEWKGSMPDPASGEVVATRSEQIVESNDKFSLMSYGIGPDGSEFPIMKLVYTRK
jgi:hypothetical protein